MEIVAKILYGSQNYNLADENSDYDFKLIVRPDFDDLYCGHNLNEKKVTPASYDPNHYSTMDVRQWFNLLKKGNVNAVEYLFSTDIEYRSVGFAELVYEARDLYREGYLKNAWPTFVESATGVALHAIKRQGMTKKTISRASYYLSVIYYLLRRDCIMDYDVWRSNDVTAFARELRFTETGDTFVKYMTEEQMKTHFAVLPKNRFTPDPSLAIKMYKLQNKIYNYIKGEIITNV